MDQIVSIFWTFSEVISTNFICDTMLSRKKGKNRLFTGQIVTFLIIFAFTNLCITSIPPVIISCGTYLLLTCYCYNGSWSYRVMAIIMSVLFLSVLDTLIIYIWSSALHIDFSEILNRKYTYLTIGTVSKGTALLLSWILRRIKASGRRKTQVKWLALICLFPAISLIMLLVVYDSFQNNSDFSLKALAFTLTIALGNIGIMYLIHQLEISERELRKTALLDQQMEIQTQSILTLEKSYRNQRKISHEFSHHLSTIQTLLENGEYSVVTDYVHRLQEQRITRLFTINTHNPIIDAILNEKYQLSQEYGIDMQLRVSDLSGINIPTEYLVVMLSNLLENAIEACLACSGDRTITISFVCDQFVFLTIDNTSNPVNIVDGKSVTSKANSLNHGFGLENACKILDQLNAEYAFQYSNGYFHFAAEFPKA